MKKLIGLLFCFLFFSGSTVVFLQPEVPTVASVPDGFIGYSGPDTTTLANVTNDEGQGQLFTTTTAGQVGYCHAYVGNVTTSSQFNIAIYDSTGTTKLAESNLTAIATGTSGEIDFTLDSPYTIEASTSYYLIFGSSNDTDWQVRGDATGSGSAVEDTDAFTVDNTMPSTFATTATHDASADVRVYCDNSPTGV